ncbi:MAG: VWA domain-containing protein [Candidatus Delongbacteria bacterium]|nr:VWA domain-containing protein [Candidatus Delongbacteria bacterium]
MIRFLYPHLLYALLIIPLLIILYSRLVNLKKKVLRRFAHDEILNKITPYLSFKRQYLKFSLILLSILFMILAVARPQFGTRMEVVKRKGIDLIIALDISSSMLAEDISPNRLIRAKMEIDQIIDQLKGDRIGLVIFSGVSFVQCPLTLDYSAAKMMLDIIHPDLIQSPGTNIGDAIQMAQKSFGQDDQKSKVLLLISDGEDHQGEIKKTAEEASANGIRIFTVGIGSPEGVPIPQFDASGNRIGYKKDRTGTIIVSKLDESILEQIALLTNGKYYQATPSNSEIHKIFEEIDKMDKKEFDARKFSQYEERYYIPLAFSLLFLIAESIIPDRKRKKQIWKGRFEL